jgi:hypothetical protein
VLALALGIAPALPRAGAVSVPPCALVAVAPPPDRTVACSFLVRNADGTGHLAVGVSRDAGRSWRQPAATGLVTPPSSLTVYSPGFSPQFSRDHTMLLPTEGGLFVSRDFGESWALVDPLLVTGGRSNPAPYIGPGVLPGTEQLYAAYAGGPRTARIDPDLALHQPAAGAPGGTELFLPHRLKDGGWEMLALGHVGARYGPVTTTEPFAVYSCTAELACAMPLFEFPAGYRRADAWVSGDTIYVALFDDTLTAPRIDVWRSTDGGRSFTRASAVERILAASTPARVGIARIGFALNAATPRIGYLRVVAGLIDPTVSTVPREQVWRTTDGGTTWTRAGYQWGTFQHGSGGTLPWREPSFASDPGANLVLAGDGRLFATGRARGAPDPAAFCSTDAGRSWSHTCRR